MFLKTKDTRVIEPRETPRVNCRVFRNRSPILATPSDVRAEPSVELQPFFFLRLRVSNEIYNRSCQGDVLVDVGKGWIKGGLLARSENVLRGCFIFGLRFIYKDDITFKVISF